MILTGKNAVREALKAGTAIRKLCIQKGIHGTQEVIDLAKSAGVRFTFEEKIVLDRLAQSGEHRGVVAVAEEYQYAVVEDILSLAKEKNEPLLMLILDGIEDPHNLGAILRAAECAGAHGVVIPERRSASVNETVVKTSAGAAAFVKVAQVNNINDTVRFLTDRFVNVYAADMGGESVYGADLKGDTAIIIGGEDAGVRQLTKKLAARTISLPQNGKVNSLNASVATGILLYEALRQRRGAPAGKLT